MWLGTKWPTEGVASDYVDKFKAIYIQHNCPTLCKTGQNKKWNNNVSIWIIVSLFIHLRAYYYFDYLLMTHFLFLCCIRHAATAIASDCLVCLCAAAACLTVKAEIKSVFFHCYICWDISLWLLLLFFFLKEDASTYYHETHTYAYTLCLCSW